MKPFNTKERFSIPNLMGYFRLLLIPVFCYLYLAKEAYHWAAGGCPPLQSHGSV